MKLSSVGESILRAIEEFEIIDAHEHLPPEIVRLEHKADVFTLFSHYTRVDLWAAGMPRSREDAWGPGIPGDYWDMIHNPSIPLEKRWEMFSPYLKMIRHGSYARPAFIAAREIYGFDDINEKNYKEVSERIAAENRPGIYRRILREKCRIRVALTQHNRTDYDLDLLIPLMPLDVYASVRSRKTVDEHAARLGWTVRNLDDYLEMVREGLEKWRSQGVVGLKMSSHRFLKPSRSRALALFDMLMHDDGKQLPFMNPLYCFLVDEILKMAANLRMVVAVHTGMWGDFRDLDPQHMIPIFQRHLDTRFDVYHLGVPYVREAVIIGKNSPNVWLNMCWCHIISQRLACTALDEMIDLVPVNKIIAFGGDYEMPVEKVYGHLVMAREDVARVLGKRVEEGFMTESEAVELARMWFYENPRSLYQLKV
ncbi:MAG: amidohydrolase family protein [Candidatus Brockarchaeota archaeon]|nr:amidohydrolase family protein [Candidatus Brockarchaeota archaeon]